MISTYTVANCKRLNGLGPLRNITRIAFQLFNAEGRRGPQAEGDTQPLLESHPGGRDERVKPTVRKIQQWIAEEDDVETSHILSLSLRNDQRFLHLQQPPPQHRSTRPHLPPSQLHRDFESIWRHADGTHEKKK